MTEGSRDLRFYFDYISSNAYLAWREIQKLGVQYGRRVEPIPVLFAGLLEAHGQMGPAEIPPKAMWMAKNNLRKAALLGIELNPPAAHPFNPLLALRVSSLPMPDPTRAKLIDGLFRAVWAQRRSLMEPAVVSAIASEAGIDGDKAITEAGRPEIKDALRSATDSAIAAGVFGVPTILVEDELFWGYDDFPYLERLLAGNDPLDREALSDWFQPRPSFHRRRPRHD